MTQRFKWVLAAVAFGPIMIVLMAAGVNGIFNNITVNGNAAVTGTINSTTGYKTNGSVGAAGQALCSDGTYYDTACSIPGGTVYYQTVLAAGSTRTQRVNLNFLSPFTATDDSGATATDISLANSGVGAGIYSYPASITVSANGLVSSVTGGSAYNVETQTNCLTTACAGGSTYASGFTYTNSSGKPVTEEVTMQATGSCTGTDLQNCRNYWRGFGTAEWNYERLRGLCECDVPSTCRSDVLNNRKSTHGRRSVLQYRELVGGKVKILALLLFPLVFLGQSANQSGQLIAANFGQWKVPAADNGYYNWTSGNLCKPVSNGVRKITAFTAGTPVVLVDTDNAANNETVTPTAVTISDTWGSYIQNAGTCTTFPTITELNANYLTNGTT